MPPLIGITTSYDYNKNTVILKHGYFNAIEKAGGIPIAVLPIVDEKTILGLTKLLDGIIFSGGPDIDPIYFGESPHPKMRSICPQRDMMEIFLAKEMHKMKKPILGICRGIQVINVAFGGSVIQDIPSEIINPIKHEQEAPGWYGTHKIEIEPNSVLFNILGKRYVRVNSFHHQSVNKIAPGFKPIAFTADGIVEAIEAKSSEAFCLGLQWHPEEMWEKDLDQFNIFKTFVKAIKH